MKPSHAKISKSQNSQFDQTAKDTANLSFFSDTPTTKRRMRPRRKLSSSSSNVVGKYRLGDRKPGGFGEVFYAQNHNTGDFVVVKRIPLRNMKKEQLNGVLEEINLLKMLDNPNIVRYIDMVKTEEHLHMFLNTLRTDRCRISSRDSVLFRRRFVQYISQVLRPSICTNRVLFIVTLGANILTTKDGQVKLADFGIAVRKAIANGHIDVCVRGVRASYLELSQEYHCSPYFYYKEITEHQRLNVH